MRKCRWIGADRSFCICVLIAFFAAVSGCHNNSPPPQPKPTIQEPLPGGPVSPSGRPVVPISRPDAMDAAGNGTLNAVSGSPPSPSIVAQRTKEYIRTMESAMERKTTADQDARLASAQIAPITPPASAQATAPSAVQWEEPRLSLSPQMLQAAIPAASSPDPHSSMSPPVSSPSMVANTASSIEPPANQIAIAPPMRLSNSVDAGSTPALTKDSLDQQLASRVRDYPHDLSAQLDYELERFVTDQPVPDLNTLASLPGEDSELLSAVLDGLENFRNSVRADGNMLMARKVAPLLDAAERLRARAGLTLPTVRLCTDVYSYGKFKPYEGDPPHFDAGKVSQFIIYCEVANFSSEQADDRQWRTDLKETAMLYSDQGVPEWQEIPKSVTDESRSRRHDFFIAQMLSLPATLSPGKHLLKVTVEDTQSHRFAETTVPLLVTAISVQ